MKKVLLYTMNYHTDIKNNKLELVIEKQMCLEITVSEINHT